MTDPCQYERMYKDDPITNEPDYDDPIEQETDEEYQQGMDYREYLEEESTQR